MTQPIVVLKSDTKIILVDRVKGEPGRPGTVTQLIAPSALGGGRVITASGSYADSSDLSTLNKAIGFTIEAVIPGGEVSILSLGELNGFFSLTPGAKLYLATSGLISEIPPITGYIQQVGVALTSSSIFIQLTPSILLI